MPDTFYNKAQTESILGVLGGRVKAALAAATLKSAIEALANTNFLTDAEKSKLAGLEGSKFLGTFTSAGNIPTVSAVAGSYADVDAGVGQNVQRYIWDDDDSQFVLQAGSSTSETAASVKTKYESNADTNAFTDAEKTKLGNLTVADNTTAAIAAFDAGLA